MKRSFSALFVLITALSGPLVFTPPAISRPKAVASPEDAAARDEEAPEADDSLRSRSEQEHNQPHCTFPLEQWQSPESLIVLPEDYDYEIYSEDSDLLCGDEAMAALAEWSRNDPRLGIQELSELGPEPPQWQSEFPLESEVGFDAQLEALCSPLADAISQWESWDGPAIAGGMTEDAAEEIAETAEPELCPAELALSETWREWAEIEAEHLEAWECELADLTFLARRAREEEIQSLLFGRWALNLYEEKTYNLFQHLWTKLAVGQAELKRHIDWIEAKSREPVLALLAELKSTSLLGFQNLAASLEEIAQTVENNEVVINDRPSPTPPFCECWAREALSSDDDSLDLIAQNSLEAPAIESEFNAEQFAEDQVIDHCPLIEPVLENASASAALEYSEPGQNDALPPHEVRENHDAHAAETIDFEAIQDTAQQAWKWAQERAQTLERWSQEYELELPNEAPEAYDADDIYLH